MQLEQSGTIFGHLIVAGGFGLNISYLPIWTGPACSKKRRQDTNRQKQRVPNGLAKVRGIEPVEVIC